MIYTIRNILIKASALIRATISRQDKCIYVHINDCPAISDSMGIDMPKGIAYCANNGRKCDNLQMIYRNTGDIQCKMKNPDVIISE